LKLSLIGNGNAQNDVRGHWHESELELWTPEKLLRTSRRRGTLISAAADQEAPERMTSVSTSEVN